MSKKQHAHDLLVAATRISDNIDDCDDAMAREVFIKSAFEFVDCAREILAGDVEAEHLPSVHALRILGAVTHADVAVMEVEDAIDAYLGSDELP